MFDMCGECFDVIMACRMALENSFDFFFEMSVK